MNLRLSLMERSWNNIDLKRDKKAPHSGAFLCTVNTLFDLHQDFHLTHCFVHFSYCNWYVCSIFCLAF